MKYFNIKSLLAGVCLMTGFVPAMAQEADGADNEKVLFSCDFQDLATAQSQFTSYELSGNTPSQMMLNVGFSKGRGWLLKLMDSYASTNFYAGCTSQFSPAGTANAWLVSQPILLPGRGCRLEWKSESYDPDNLDGIKVFVSTTGGNPKQDFGATPLWECDAEPAGDTETLDNEWNEHSVSLDAYAGKTVWIAFVNQTTDGSILCVDDISVVMDAPYTLTPALPTFTTQESLGVGGTLTSIHEALDGGTVYYTDELGHKGQISLDGMHLNPGESHTFTLPCSLTFPTANTYYTYRMWYASADSTMTIVADGRTAHASFVPCTAAVIEEGTGTWCGWCPQGILAIERLQEMYPDNVIAIAVHNDDVLTDAEYDSALGFPTFPAGLVNRYYGAYPMMQDGYNFYFNKPGTFGYAVEQVLAQPAEVQPTVVSATLEGGILSVKGNVRFAIRPDETDYAVVYAVVEDSVVGTKFTQSNYLADYTLPEFGKFANGGEFGRKYLLNYTFMDVARGVFPSFSGQTGVIPSKAEVETDYPCSIDIDLTEKSVADSTHLRVVMMLTEVSSGRVLNAHQLPVTFTGTVSTGISHTTPAGATIRIDRNGRLQLPAGTQSARVYTISGQNMGAPRADGDISHLPHGVYVVECRTADGVRTAVVRR